MIQRRQIAAAAAGVLLGYGIWAAAQGGAGANRGAETEYAGRPEGGGENAGTPGEAARPGQAAPGEAAMRGQAAPGNSASGGAAAGEMGRAGVDITGRAAAGGGLGGALGAGLAAVLQPEVSEQEREAVERLYDAVESGDKAKIAAELLADGDTFSWLFYETFGEERYRYDGTGFQADLAGEGLVLTGAASIFYGSFGKNGPEGACTALQAVELDKPRYDYSEGTWKDGRMDGPGVSGYRYYDGPPQGEAEEVRKEGRFVRGRMEGKVTYMNTGSDGEKATWTLEVKDGVTQRDDRWIEGPEKGVYHLPADDNPAYAYALTEREMSQPRWVNLLVWDIDD